MPFDGAMLKFGFVVAATTVSEMVVVAERFPDVPVIVIVEVPVGVAVFVFRLTTLVPVAGSGL